MADHLDTAAWAHLRGPARARVRWSRTESMGQVTARVYRVGSSARAVSDAIDAWYRDIDALRSADGDAADPGVRTEEREPGV